MNKKNLIVMIAIIYCHFSYGNYPEKSSLHHQHQHSSHQQSHLNPAKQDLWNNYQRRYEMLLRHEENPSYATSGYLIGVATFVAIFIGGILGEKGPAKAAGILGAGACGLGALMSSINASSDKHANQIEMAELLEKQAKLQE
jgi:hypothetical protein